MKILKRILPCLMLVIYLTVFINSLGITACADAQYVYPKGWKEWNQSRNNGANWGVIDGEYACAAISMCKLQIQAQGITDSNYTPTVYYTWALGKGYITTGSYVNNWDGLANYDESINPLRYHDRKFYSSNATAIKDIIKYRKDGYGVIVNVHGGGHYELAGDPISDSDVELIDSYPANVHKATDAKTGMISNIVIFKAQKHDVPCGVNESETEPKSDAEKEVEDAVGEVEDSSNAPAYRLAQYDENELASLAIIQNKYMTDLDLATFKWNMIVSQFAVPYFRNNTDVLKTSMWQKFYKNINNLSLDQDEYFKLDDVTDNSTYTEGMKKYLEYLKQNAGDLKTALKRLADASEYIYTPLYNENEEVATIYDMYYGSALYVKDNVTVVGSEFSSERIKTDENTDVKIDTDDDDDATSSNGEEDDDTPETDKDKVASDEDKAADSTNTSDDVTSEQIRNKLWESMESMYTPSEGNRKEFYSSINDGARVETTWVPAYVNTDSTQMYNTLFTTIGQRCTTEQANNSSEGFIAKQFGDNALYVDQYGNIYAKTNTGAHNSMVIVYPSYANPLYLSTELEPEDIAGVYYGNLSEILKVSSSGTTAATTDGKVKITNKKVTDLITELKDYDVNKYLGMGSPTSNKGSFQTHYLLTSSGVSSKDKVYYRKGSKASESKKNTKSTDKRVVGEIMPYAHIDTTTNAICSKMFLSSYSSVLSKHAGKKLSDWYEDLNSPYTNYNALAKPDWLKALLHPGSYEPVSRFSGTVIMEKYDGRLTYKVSTSGADATYQTAKINNKEYYVLPTVAAYSLPNWVLESGYFTTSGRADTDMPLSGGYIQYARKAPVQGIEGNRKMDLGSKSSTAKTSIPAILYGDVLKNALVDSTLGNPKFSKNNYIGKEYFQNVRSFATLVSNRKNGNSAAIANVFTKQNAFTDTTNSDAAGYYYAEAYNLYSVIDSARFNTYFTFNTDLNGESASNPQKKAFTRAISGTYANIATNGEINPGVGDSNITRGSRQLTFPILSYVIDDTTGWGLWNGAETEVNSIRSSDQTVYDEVGLFEPVAQSNKNNLLGANSYLNALRYYKNGTYVTDFIDSYPASDIISIAYMWDSYYLCNSPLVTKMDLKTVNENSVYGERKAYITLYNGISEGNNNTLYYTTDMTGDYYYQVSLKDKISGANLAYNAGSINAYADSITAPKPVYSISYNVPNLVLAINKNGYGANLQRWIDNLKDEDGTAKYMMDLITEFTEKPVTAVKNVILGFAQMIHYAIAKGTTGSFCNIGIITDLVQKYGGLNIFFAIEGVIVALGLVVKAVSFVTNKNKNFSTLFRDLGITILVGTIPIVMLLLTQQVISSLTAYMMNDITPKMVLTSLEGYKLNNKKISYKSDVDIFLETKKYDVGSIGDLDVSIPIGYDPVTKKASYSDVSLEDLYKSISYSYVRGDASMSLSKKNTPFGGLKKSTTAVWYSNKRYVPVNYDKYQYSVFYYFYDWLKYQYLAYNKDNDVCSKYIEPYNLNEQDPKVDQTKYLSVMQDAETEWIKLGGGVIDMYTNPDYVYATHTPDKTEGYNDMFGLSNLFRMVTTTSKTTYGAPNSWYKATMTLDSWANKRSSSDKSLITDYKKYQKALESKSSDVDDVMPLAAVVKSDVWGLYAKSKKIYHQADNEADMYSYTFTPTYIQKFCEDQKLKTVKKDFAGSWKLSKAALKVKKNQRVPWRTYGTAGLVYKATGNYNLTKLEQALDDITAKTYAQTLELVNLYRKDEISDDTLLFTIALYATMNFNSEFDVILGDGIGPTQIDTNSISTDNLYRITYASSVKDVVDNANTMYMIYYNHGGIGTVIMVLLSEIFLLVTIVLRAVIFLLLFVSTAIICFETAVKPPKNIRLVAQGLITQILILVLSQIGMILTIKLNMQIISNTVSGVAGVLVGLVFVIVFVAIAVWHLFMIISLIKNIKEYGGALITGKIKNIRNEVNNKYVSTKNRAAEMIATLGVGRLVGTSIHERTEEDVHAERIQRRKLNSKRIDKSTEDRETLKHKRRLKHNKSTHKQK